MIQLDEKNNMEKWNKSMVKIKMIVGVITLFLLIVGGGLLSLFLILAYGLPIDGFEKNPNMVHFGLGILGTIVFSILFWKGIFKLSEYLDRKRGKFTTEMKPERWPSPNKRIVKNTLTYMSQKTGIFVWDVVIVCIIMSLAIMVLCTEDYDIGENIFALAGTGFFCMGVRVIFVLYYHFRDFTKSMLNNYDTYGGYLDHGILLERLEESLKNRLLFYSPQWIITEDFFMAWIKSSQFYSPIAISLQEMRQLRYEVRRDTYRGRVIFYNVIVCQLKSGKSVDLYIGDKWKVEGVINVLNYFRIPFENSLNEKGNYVPPYEITVTPPGKILK